MCRILGYLSATAPLPAGKLGAALRLLRAGGPDEQSLVSFGRAALGSTRLAIVDPDGGHQPYSGPGGDILVVFNGEIYNHRELRKFLGVRGYRFPDGCDGQVIPAAYHFWGEDFPRHLDGMFAVAVLDRRRGQDSLLLAVDHLGIKPVYYHWDHARSRLCFASEIPALLRLLDVKPGIWLPGVDSYLTTKAVFGEHTLFQGVKVMPPAGRLTFRGTGPPRLTHWSTALPETPPFDGDRAAAAAQVRELLTDEVHSLLQADVPVAGINSGGLDSSLVAAIASRLLGTRFPTFHLCYAGDWPGDERAYARELAESSGTLHREVEVDPCTDLIDCTLAAVRGLGQPNADPIAPSTYALARAVRQAGFKVCLTGDISDELFGGYDRLARAARSGDADRWLGEYIEALAAVPGPLRQALYSADYQGFLREHGTARAALEDDLRGRLGTPGGRLPGLLRFEQARRLPAYHLRRVDHLFMAHAVEARVPYGQRRLVDLARRLPPGLLITGTRVKQVLYDAADGLVPPSILDRPKQPFTLPVSAMMRPGTPLHRFIDEALDPAEIRRRGLFDPAAVRRLFRSHGESPGSGTALAVWSLLIFELWLREFGL